MKKYRINEVAEKFGIAPSRIRHYENEQLIKCKRDPENNYRYFDDEDMLKIASVLMYRSLGLTLKDISAILDNEKSIEKHLYKQVKLISEEIQSLMRAREKVYNIIKSNNVEAASELFEVVSVLEERDNFMKKINYNQVSQVYDKVRAEDQYVVDAILKTATVHSEGHILDIGCGTGNYTTTMKSITQAHVHGVDPSKGMLAKARQKNDDITYKLGTASEIPYDESTFSLIYMTDVIHHVPDIDEMFREIYRVTEKNGKVCICTQSHRQIENRYMSEFFPGTAVADKKRYPAIFDILQSGENAGFKYFKTEVMHEDVAVELGEEFLELLVNKGYSMLHQISEEEYQSGLKAFKENMKDGSFMRKSAGGSLVWLEKVE